MFVTGSIRPRKKTNGTRYWQLTAELGRDPVSQKRLRKYRSVEGTKKEAERALRAFIAEIEKGMYVTDTKITVHEWVDTWLEVYIVPNVSPTTLSRYEGMIKRYIKPILGHVQVQQLTTLAVQAWVNGLKTSPVSGKEMSAATIKHSYHVLKGAMDKAVLTGIIPRSPCTGIMLPKGQKKPPVVYDELQIKQLIAAAKGTEMEIIIDIELCLGLRRGELLGLRWQDIDFEKNQVHIVKNRVVVNGKAVVKDPKTETSCRTVDAPVQMMEKLRKHKTNCLANRLRLGQAYTLTDYVIVHPDGKPIYPEYVSQMLTKLQKKAGLPKCRFHDLRHLCASIMLMQGVNVKVAKEHLGHKDIATTMNIYTHVLPSVAKDAAQKIGALVYDVG